MGDLPTHPELLDWLAREFVRQGWSIKAMHRLMMTSATYRQSSATTASSHDPGNQLWSRMPLRRLAAEELRDSLLWVSGQLDEQRFGPAEPVRTRGDGMVLSGKRRSVYVEQSRKSPPSLLESFDLPAMNPNCLQRTDSLVAPQALHLLNDTAVREMAARFAERVLASAGPEPARQVEQVYWLALGRPPSPEEQTACLQTSAGLTAKWAAEAGTRDGIKTSSPGQVVARKALATLCHTIMNSAAFLYVD
jgi:hypothetical protein